MGGWIEVSTEGRSAGWKRVWEKRKDEEKNSIRLEEGRTDREGGKS